MTYKKSTSIEEIKTKLKKLNVDTSFLDVTKPKKLKEHREALLKESPTNKRDKLILEFKLSVIEKVLSESKSEIKVSKDLKDTKSTLQTAEYKIVSLREKLESVKRKNASNPSKEYETLITTMSEQIEQAEDQLNEHFNGIAIRSQLNEDAQTAESIMASIAIQEEISEIQKELGKLQNDTLGKFIEQVRVAYDAEMVEKIKAIAEPAIQELMDQIRDTKDKLYEVVSMLTGDESLDDMIASGELGDMETDSEEQELEDAEGVEGDSEGEDLPDLDDLETEAENEEVDDSEWEKR